MVKSQEITNKYALYNGDCCEVLKELPSESVDFSIFSPPFLDLFSYSDSPNDMGNCKTSKEFFLHFFYMVSELSRLVKPGRIVAVHCIDIPAMKERDGYIGLKDFPGDIIRCFQQHGFIYHSRHTIWKDPLIEATRTKALGLMHKQLCKDSAMCRSGLPDYLLAFRQKGENNNPVSHPEGLSHYCGSDDPGGSGVSRSHNIWRAYASPVWMDIRQSDTLNKSLNEKRAASDDADTKHICPLQTDVIERGLILWSNPGDVVLTPFMGVGSEVYVSVMNKRKGIGIELKESYYKQAVKNVERAAETRVESIEILPQ